MQSLHSLIHNPAARLRKLAAKLICELAAEDEDSQTMLCELFGFTSMNGKICINKMPSKLREQIIKNPKLLNTIREYENIDKKKKYWCYPLLHGENAKKVNSGYTLGEELVKDFPDPAEHWLGFICANIPNTTKHRQNYSVVNNINSPENDRVSSPVFEPAKSGSNKKQAKKTIQSFINKLPISPTRTVTNPIHRTTMPVTVQVLKKGEEEKLFNTVQHRTLDTQKFTDFPQNPSFDDLIIEEQEDNIEEESPKFVSAGSGSESASKFRFSMANRQTPLLIDDEFQRLESEANDEIAHHQIPTKIPLNKPKPGTAKPSKQQIRKPYFGKTQPIPPSKPKPVTATASNHPKTLHTKKLSTQIKPKTARGPKKDINAISKKIQEIIKPGTALKTVIEVNESKRKSKELNYTTNITVNSKYPISMSSQSQRNRIFILTEKNYRNNVVYSINKKKFRSECKK